MSIEFKRAKEMPLPEIDVYKAGQLWAGKLQVSRPASGEKFPFLGAWCLVSFGDGIITRPRYSIHGEFLVLLSCAFQSHISASSHPKLNTIGLALIGCASPLISSDYPATTASLLDASTINNRHTSNIMLFRAFPCISKLIS